MGLLSDLLSLATPSSDRAMASDAAATASRAARERSLSADTTTGRLLQKKDFELKHVTDECDDLKQQLAAKEQQLAEKDKQLQAALQSTAKQDYQNKIKAVHQKYEALKLQNQRLRKARDHSQKHSNSLQETLEARDRDIRQLQAEKLQSLESAQWAPLASSDIKHEINSILASIRQWSLDHSAVPAEALAESKWIELVHQRLTRLGCISMDCERMMKVIGANKTLQKPGKAAVFLLSTLASAFLLHQILADPFFALHDPSLHFPNGNCPGAVAHILNLIRSGNVEEAEGLRCHLVRSLHNSIKQEQERSCKLAQDIAWWFVQDFARPFWGSSEESSNMIHDFLPIVEQVIKLAWQVWTRKARLEVLVYADLLMQPPFPGHVVYTSSSDKLELHSMHNKEVDDDATALDRFKCLVLGSPVVVLAGNADGKEYDKKRVVRKGVVWLG